MKLIPIVSQNNLEEMYLNQKLGCHSIAKLLNTTPNRIYRHLKFYEISIRQNEYRKTNFRGFYLKGRIFGDWKVLKEDKENRTSNNKYWICKCTCGKIKSVTARNLVHGLSKNCGCVSIRKRRLEFGQAARNRLFGKYKNQAKRRGIEFSLTLDDFLRLTSEKCFYCKSEPSTFLGKRREDSLYGYYKYNGIDRIDNNTGYLLKNSVSCCSICNRMKGTLSQDMFLKQIVKIANERIEKCAS